MAEETFDSLHDESHRPIKIVVAYPWEKDDDKNVKNPRSDSRWQFLKGKATSEANAVKTLAEKRPGSYKLEIRIERLRGRHGHMLLSSVRERIERADVLLMDIGSMRKGQFNPNVLIEVGIAVGCDHCRQGGLFILKPQKLDIPSDLKGFLFTEYRDENDGIKLIDDTGFRAALRATLSEIGKSRGMLGKAREASVRTDDDEDDSPPSKFGDTT